MRNDRRLDRRADDDRLTDADAFALGDHQHLIERDFRADVGDDPFDLQFFARGNLVLLTAGFDDRVHERLLPGGFAPRKGEGGPRKVLNYIGFCAALSKRSATKPH